MVYQRRVEPRWTNREAQAVLLALTHGPDSPLVDTSLYNRAFNKLSKAYHQAAEAMAAKVNNPNPVPPQFRKAKNGVSS